MTSWFCQHQGTLRKVSRLIISLVIVITWAFADQLWCHGTLCRQSIVALLQNLFITSTPNVFLRKLWVYHHYKAAYSCRLWLRCWTFLECSLWEGGHPMNERPMKLKINKRPKIICLFPQKAWKNSSFLPLWQFLFSTICQNYCCNNYYLITANTCDRVDCKEFSTPKKTFLKQLLNHKSILCTTFNF